MVVQCWQNAILISEFPEHNDDSVLKADVDLLNIVFNF